MNHAIFLALAINDVVRQDGEKPRLANPFLADHDTMPEELVTHRPFGVCLACKTVSCDLNHPFIIGSLYIWAIADTGYIRRRFALKYNPMRDNKE